MTVTGVKLQTGDIKLGQIISTSTQKEKVLFQILFKTLIILSQLVQHRKFLKMITIKTITGMLADFPGEWQRIT